MESLLLPLETQEDQEAPAVLVVLVGPAEEVAAWETESQEEVAAAAADSVDSLAA